MFLAFDRCSVLQISRQQLVTRSPNVGPRFLHCLLRSPCEENSYGSIPNLSLLFIYLFLFCLVSELPWVMWGARDRFTIAGPSFFFCFKTFGLRGGLHKARIMGLRRAARSWIMTRRTRSNSTGPQYIDNVNKDARFG